MGEMMKEYAYEIRDDEGNLILPIDLLKGVMTGKYEIIEIKEQEVYFNKRLVSIKVVNCEDRLENQYIDKNKLKDKLTRPSREYLQYSLSFSEAVIIDRIFSDINKVIEND